MKCSQIPASILGNEALNSAISILPANYNFEVSKFCEICCVFFTLADLSIVVAQILQADSQDDMENAADERETSCCSVS